MPEHQSMQYFKFDADDLYANQNRRFTEKQRLRLISLDKSRRKTSLAIGIVLAVVGLIGPIIAIAAGLANPDPLFIIGFGGGFGLVWPAVWGGIGFVLIKGAMGKTVFKLASVQGRANIVARESRSTDSHGHTSTTSHHESHVGGVCPPGSPAGADCESAAMIRASHRQCACLPTLNAWALFPSIQCRPPLPLGGGAFRVAGWWGRRRTSSINHPTIALRCNCEFSDIHRTNAISSPGLDQFDAFSFSLL